jgi:hypothetical protein
MHKSQVSLCVVAVTVGENVMYVCCFCVLQKSHSLRSATYVLIVLLLCHKYCHTGCHHCSAALPVSQMFIYQNIPYRRPVPTVNRKEERSDWRKEPSEKRTTDSSGPRRGPEDDRRRVDDRGRGDRNLGPRDDPPVRESKGE